MHLVGIGLGQLVPGLFHALGTATVAQINLPVAVLLWLMVIPMMLKIDLAALGQVKSYWRGIVATVGINWLVKPFSMALLGWLFIGVVFRPYLPAGMIDGYMAGLILLVAAPCTAMVFVWSNLVDGVLRNRTDGWAAAPVLTGWEPRRSAIYAVYPSRRNMAPRTRAVIDFFLDEFRIDPIISSYGKA